MTPWRGVVHALCTMRLTGSRRPYRPSHFATATFSAPRWPFGLSHAYIRPSHMTFSHETAFSVLSLRYLHLLFAETAFRALSAALTLFPTNKRTLSAHWSHISVAFRRFSGPQAPLGTVRQTLCLFFSVNANFRRTGHTLAVFSDISADGKPLF